jgi:hypothetical protein
MLDTIQRVVARHLASKSSGAQHQAGNYGWDGPYLYLTPDYAIYWMDLGELYGRVHHITEDLVKAEARMDLIQRHVLGTLHPLGIHIDPGEIIVDGLGGRNHMVIRYSVGSSGGPWDENKVGDALGLKYAKDYKKPPR